ncbi:unnamed protein product [Tuber aestivum]|uniref:Extracellular metalloproteinase n=1 Tax=Tuber aestivum TaxID=59557 RepID=A0A292PR80_9PEZI|nr:unnamed protein product [Tuber aestivum]
MSPLYGASLVTKGIQTRVEYYEGGSTLSRPSPREGFIDEIQGPTMRQLAIPGKINGLYANTKVLGRRSAPGIFPRDKDPAVIATKYLRLIAPGVSFRHNNDQYTDADTGVTHVYFTQTLNGLDIENAQANVNIRSDGTILSAGTSVTTQGLDGLAPVRRAQLLDPLEALEGVVETLGLRLNIESAQAVPESSITGGGLSFIITGSKGAVSEPKADLAYYNTPEGVKLVWKLETDLNDNWLISYANAQQKGQVEGAVDYVSDASYEVYKIGLNDPTEGARTLEVDPATKHASPGGWHTAGNESYRTTRGNNGIAQENWDGGTEFLKNRRPDGGKRLKFNFPYSLNETKPKNYIKAAITQLFYTANIYHDLLEVLGFTEEAGNFEEVNTGSGGIGNDAVQLNAQEGAVFNDANFASPEDGVRPRLRMYIWNTPEGGPVQRDGDFDNGIIIHEYTHGLSSRLTGGPAQPTCLNTVESRGMSEGWSDFYATAIRIKPKDNRDTSYGLADWADGVGIRRYPYSTNMTTNPTTYAIINLPNWSPLIHRIGCVWGNILYEIMWNLEDKHGYREEVFPKFRSGTTIPTTGRHLAMKLVLEGMKLQPCNPTFITARDAIIDADGILTGGENFCELWKGFAKRGVGVDASQGKGANARVESFDLPENWVVEADMRVSSE